jgi:SAM-dependent methyltransferase
MTLDNLVEYNDPLIYDLENRDFEPDGPVILGFAKKTGSPVLELGCGTGRLTIPLARAGIDITGLDLVSGMLARAREKAGDLPIHWIQADVRSFRLDRTFRLIFESGSVFQHMLTRADQEAFLTCVHEHLAERGLFVFGAFFPSLNMLADVDEEKSWFTTWHPAGWEIRVSGRESYDALRQVKTETAYRRWTDPDGCEHVQVAPLALRYTFPRELEALLHYNGFEIVEQYGDNDLSPLTNESSRMISVCRKRP